MDGVWVVEWLVVSIVGSKWCGFGNRGLIVHGCVKDAALAIVVERSNSGNSFCYDSAAKNSVRRPTSTDHHIKHKQHTHRHTLQNTKRTSTEKRTIKCQKPIVNTNLHFSSSNQIRLHLLAQTHILTIQFNPHLRQDESRAEQNQSLHAKVVRRHKHQEKKEMRMMEESLTEQFPVAVCVFRAPERGIPVCLNEIETMIQL